MTDRADPIWDAVARLQDGAALTSVDKLIVTISPKVELLLVAAMLAAPTPAPGHYGTLDHPIPGAARAWFASYTEHPAVQTIRHRFYNQEATGFACDALIRFILTYGEPPTLAAYPPAAGSPQQGDVLANQLRDFYQHTQFAAFWATHAAAYQAIECQIAGYAHRGWTGEDVVATLEHYLYTPLAAAMRPWGYVTWPIALNEHILRAQNCRLRRQLLGDASAETQLQLEEQQGFGYIRVLEAKLADYEAQRDRYRHLAAFYRKCARRPPPHPKGTRRADEWRGGDGRETHSG